MDRKVVRVLFDGDSTTDVGRARPIGDGFGKMGDSYLANIFRRHKHKNAQPFRRRRCNV